MRNGDIFDWVWKPETGGNNSRELGDYRCFSGRAVFREPKLLDTFWGMGADAHALDLSRIDVQWVGNVHDMTEIQEWDIPLYRREDIVDMRHANMTRGPIYLRAGAVKDAQPMLAEAERRMV